MEKCPSYRGVRLTIVRLIEVFLGETHLCSAGTCGSVRLGEVSVLWDVRLREVSVLWDVRLKRFHCIALLAGALFHRQCIEEVRINHWCTETYITNCNKKYSPKT